jgi:hypothetical protein
MEARKDAQPRRRKPASPRARLTRGGRAPQRISGLNPDVIWPKTGVEEAREMLRRWAAEAELNEGHEIGDIQMSALNRQDPEQEQPTELPQTDFDTAIELLRQWEEEGDEQEQRETWGVLRKALGEHRIASYRAAIPTE